MIKKILLIDDDTDDLEMFSEALSEVDPSVKCIQAIDCFIALELLEKKAEPDLIFLDINMPRMNGWECLSKLKNTEEYKNIPVIMYSTSSHQKEKETASELGASDFISKPHNYIDLKNMIRNVIATS